MEEILTETKEIIVKESSQITIKENGNYSLIREGDNSLSILIEKGIDARIEEYFTRNNSNKRVNYFTKYSLSEDSKLSYVVYNMNDKLDIKLYKSIYMDKNSNLNITFGMFGKNVDTTITADLNGEGTNINIDIMTYNDNKTKGSYNISVNHLSRNSQSNITNHGVLNNNSTCDFNVRSFIKKGSHQSSAFQHTKVICLDDKSLANLNPILLIDDYDVKAGHGATVTKISEEELYYIQSRGLTKVEAYLLVALGFLLNHIEEDKYEEISEYLKNRIEYQGGEDNE